MSLFIDWAANQFKKDAEEMGHMPQLLKTLKEESDEQWVQRVTPVMESLRINFVMTTRNPLLVYNEREDAVRIFNKLKEILVLQTAA